MDYDNLSAAEVDALAGYQREAWYAYRKGDRLRAAEILAAYEPKRAPAAVEVAEAAPVETARGRRRS